MLAEGVALLGARALLQLALGLLVEQDRQALQVGHAGDVARLGARLAQPVAVEARAPRAVGHRVAHAAVAQLRDGGRIRRRPPRGGLFERRLVTRYFYQTIGRKTPGSALDPGPPAP